MRALVEVARETGGVVAPFALAAALTAVAHRIRQGTWRGLFEEEL